MALSSLVWEIPIYVRETVTDRKSTYGLKIEQLTDLFSMGADEENHMDDMGDDKAAGDLLRNQLTNTVPKDSFLLDSVLMMKGRPRAIIFIRAIIISMYIISHVSCLQQMRGFPFVSMLLVFSGLFLRRAGLVQ